MMQNNTILELKNVHVIFRSGEVVHHILKDISFTLQKNEVLGITGESGSGKSITALSVMGLLSGSDGFDVSGDVIFKGQSLNTLTQKQMCQIRGKGISIIFQNPASALNPVKKCGIQVAEAVLIHSALNAEAAKERILSLFLSVGFKDGDRIYQSYPHELSGGELQRVMIAIALINSPDIIIADEATSSLDHINKSEMIGLLKEVQNKTGCSLIFITHDLPLLKSISDQIVMIKDGYLLDQFKPDITDMSSLSEYTRNYMQLSLTERRNVGGEGETNPVLLEVSQLSKGFNKSNWNIFRRGKTNDVLINISFTLRKGMILGVMGASGSGKSTLAKILAGILNFDSGLVFFDGAKLVDMTTGIGENRRKQVQLVFQNAFTSLNPKHTLRHALNEIISYYKLGKNPESKIQILQDIMSRVALPLDLLDKYPHQLSGGQNQRASIARSLLLNPSLIIFDESLSALDIMNQKNIMELMLELQKDKGMSVIFISHDASLIRYCCSHVLVLEEGKIKQSGKVSDVISLADD